MKTKSLLVWDMFKAHVTEKLKDHVKCTNTDLLVAVIPGGLTSVVRPLDVCLNKPFKDFICQYWSAWIIDGEKTFTKGGNMHAPPLDLLCEWVVCAWAAIDAKIVENSFLKCGILNSLDGEEDNWLWKDMDAEDDTADAEEEWDPYDDVLTGLTDAETLELFKSDDEEDEFNRF